MKILITRRIDRDGVDLLKKHFEVDYFEKNEPLDAEFLKENIEKYDAVLCSISEKFDDSLIKRASSRLKIISNMAVGLANIDRIAADKYGIAVRNTPDVVTNSTAEMTLAIALTLIRKIVPSREYIKKDLWKMWNPEIFIGREIRGMKWGILGFGRIGKSVAEKVSSLGVEILYTNRNGEEITHINSGRTPVKRVELDELLKSSDILSIHVPLMEETHHLLNYEKLSLMKKNSYVINMARGGIIESEALIKILEEKKIEGAALDVFDPEPLRGNHKILEFENVLITPHIGTATIDCRKKMATLAAQNIVDFFKKRGETIHAEKGF